MLSRRAALVATALLLAGLTGCAGTPAATPTPTPTGFASEEEAFAAAEETYRAYTDASNAVRLDDPDTFEGALAWSSGDENVSNREQFTQMSANGWTKVGNEEVVTFEGRSLDKEDQIVTAHACLDVSHVDILDADGESVVPAERSDRYSLVVTLSPGGTPTGLAVSHTEVAQETICDL